MADKRTQRMAEFYEQCQTKGYTDMYDDKQSLKAKVIATDLKLNYGDIVAFYERAKQAKAQIDREKAEEAERQRIQREEKAKETSRRAVKGELLVTISDRVQESRDAKVIRVYIRPDDSIYSTLNNGSKIEGVPTVGAKKGGAMLLTYHPSKAVYTGATVGGVTTGGVHYTDAYYSPSTTNSGKGDVAVSLGGTEFTVSLITMSDHTAKLFKRDGAYKNLVYQGQIQCFRESSKADMYISAATSGFANYETAMNSISMAVDERRLPYSTCTNIANLLGRIVHGQFPPSDEQTYKTAESMADSNSSAGLLRSYELFQSISDYKDAANRARTVKAKYEEVLQEEKERAILAKEERKKKAKKIGIVLGIIIAALIVVAILLNAVIIPAVRYNHAVSLSESGEYEKAIAAFEALEGYKDSEEQIENCNAAIIYAELERKYSEAVALMEAGNYDEAISAFSELDGYNDSEELIIKCADAKIEKSYIDAVALMEAEDYEAAISAFEELDGYKDSAAQIEECNAAILDMTYNNAIALVEAGNIDQAYDIFMEISDYKDADNYLKCFVFLPEKITTVPNSGPTKEHLFEYDSMLNMVGAEYYLNGELQYWYTFDSAGRVEQLSPQGSIRTAFTYLDDGTVEKNGIMYDVYGNMVSYKFESGGKEYAGDYSHEFDSHHNRTDDSQNEYDQSGKLLSVTYKSGNLKLYSEFEYDLYYSVDGESVSELAWKNIRLMFEDHIWHY